MTTHVVSSSKTTTQTGEHAFGFGQTPEDTLTAGDTLTLNGGITLLAKGTDAHGIKIDRDRAWNWPDDQRECRGER